MAKRTKQLQSMVDNANAIFERENFQDKDMYAKDNECASIFNFVCQVLLDNKCYKGFHPNTIRKEVDGKVYYGLVHPNDPDISKCFIRIC